MTHREKIVKKYNSLVYNHLWLKFFIDYAGAFLVSVISAAIFAFGVCVFLKPVGVQQELVSGGASGLSQDLVLLLKTLGVNIKDENLLYSIFYFAVNVPLLILALKGIGKRFTFFTLVNVVFVSIFINLFKGSFFTNLAIYIDRNAFLLGRALFAGVCTGLSSAFAFKIDSSAGGFDIVSYYISLKKSNSTGPYIVIINSFILVVFALLSGFSSNVDCTWEAAIGGIFFSIVYLFTVMLIIDFINVRNKKAQVEIVTKMKDLPNKLLSFIPHGATLINGVGVFSGQERFVIHMVVSINEVKRVVRIVKELDPESFVNVTVLQQVYGRFHMKPIK